MQALNAELMVKPGWQGGADDWEGATRTGVCPATGRNINLNINADLTAMSRPVFVSTFADFLTVDHVDTVDAAVKRLPLMLTASLRFIARTVDG